MQSSKYKIFGHGRGIDISQNTQGRNVLPFSSNKKLDQPSQKLIQSPFDGYSSTVFIQNNLAQSQVSDLNLELTRRLIKEQLNRLGLFDQAKTKNDIESLKSEIKTVKEIIVQINNSNKSSRDDEEFKKELLKDFDKLMEQYHEQTARNLRQVIKTFDQNVKKQCSTKYLPIDFINDVQKQFLEMEDRIQLVESKVDGNKKHRPSEDPVILAQAFELRLKKNQRQSESLKKSISQIQLLINGLNDVNMNLKSKQSQDDQRVRQKVQQVKKNYGDLQKQVKILSSGLEDAKKQNSELRKKLIIVEENQNKSPPKPFYKQTSSQSSDVKQFIMGTKGMTVSGVYQNDSQSYRPLFKSPVKQVTSQNQISVSISQVKQKRQKKIDEPPTLCYRIDKQNKLLDEEGNYILNEQGKQIQLTQQQISMLRKSTLVKLCE